MAMQCSVSAFSFISLGCRPFSTNIFEPRMVTSAVAEKFPSHVSFFQCFRGWTVSVYTCQHGLCLAWRNTVCMARLIFCILPSRARTAQLCINSPFVSWSQTVLCQNIQRLKPQFVEWICKLYEVCAFSSWVSFFKQVCS